MIEYLDESNKSIVSYLVTGTVIASDVKKAVCDDARVVGNAAGNKSLIFTIAPTFDGYWAEMMRGLRTLADSDGCASRIRKIAIVMPPDMRGEYETESVQDMAIDCRAFTTLKQDQAMQWLVT